MGTRENTIAASDRAEENFGAMIRDYKPEDLAAIEDMFRRSGLPSECMPDANHPLFLIKKVAVANNKPVMAAFTKLTAEQFLAGLPLKTGFKFD